MGVNLHRWFNALEADRPNSGNQGYFQQGTYLVPRKSMWLLINIAAIIDVIDKKLTRFSTNLENDANFSDTNSRETQQVTLQLFDIKLVWWIYLLFFQASSQNANSCNNASLNIAVKLFEELIS